MRQSSVLHVHWALRRGPQGQFRAARGPRADGAHRFRRHRVAV